MKTLELPGMVILGDADKITPAWHDRMTEQIVHNCDEARGEEDKVESMAGFDGPVLFYGCYRAKEHTGRHLGIVLVSNAARPSFSYDELWVVWSAGS